MTTVKGDGIFVFNECENVLQDVECRALQARVWRLYYTLAKLYLELEVLSILMAGAFVLKPPVRPALRGYGGRDT